MVDERSWFIVGIMSADGIPPDEYMYSVGARYVNLLWLSDASDAEDD